MNKNKPNRSDWQDSTRLTHSRKVELVEGNRSILSPLYQSAKFAIAADVPLAQQFFYTRVANPTLRELELTLAEMQKKEDCIVFASGLAAITGTLLGLLTSGDHVLTFRELYRPGRVFVRDILPKFGITADVLKLSQIDQLENFIRPGKTKLIYFETPSNPHLQLADIDKITRFARKHGILTLLDGTFGGPHQHTDFDLDLIVQSLTKFANGHGDVIAGSVAGSNEVIKQIRSMSIMLGATLDPHAAFLISRGLKTYYLRYERQTRTAGRVAQFLSTHLKIKKVYYPGLAHHPLHQLATEQMKEMGGILAFEIDSSLGSALEFCHRLQMVQFTASVGSTESLICPTQMFFGDDLAPLDRQEMGINEYSLRLSVGLEHEEDIIRDLGQALG